MVAIEPILEDIGRKLKTDDVRLPTAGEFESLTVDFNGANAEMPTEVGDISVPSSQSDQGVLKIRQIFGESLSHRELSSPIQEYQALELPAGSVNKKSHSSDQQEDESLNEKSDIVGDAPHTSMIQPSILPDEGPCNSNELRGSTIGQAGLVPLLPPISTGLVDVESQRSSTPRTRQWNFGLAILSLLLYKMISLPYRIGRRAEALILRFEYKHRQRGRRIWPRYRSYNHLFLSLSRPSPPRVVSNDIPSAVWGDIRLFWYYLHRRLYYPKIFLNFLLNFLYFVFCFPFIFWVVQRHRNVLEDAESLEARLCDSISMLGELPERYLDIRLLRENARMNEIDREPA